MAFNSHWHIVFDLMGFLVGSALFRLELKRKQSVSPIQGESGYWICLVGGAIVGAFLAGSLNLSLVGLLRVGHSVAGALAGGIIAVELYKLKKKVRTSTGFVFVIPLMAGIALGRIGCFMAGLSDETYGIPTSLPWGIDFGDQISRHPVQLYESLTVFLGVLAMSEWRRRNETQFQARGFYLFVLFYSVQRFIWEFLKPYPKIVGPFNLFHFLCAVMVLYAMIMGKETYVRNA